MFANNREQLSTSLRVSPLDPPITPKGVPAVPRDLTRKPHTNIATGPKTNIEEQIRHRAYELYEARGREEGRQVEDWLRAEAEITVR